MFCAAFDRCSALAAFFAVALLVPFQSKAEHITVYADASATTCSVVDNTPRLFTVYVVHTDMLGTSFSAFALATSAGFDATYVSESIPSPITPVGTLFGGISLGYPSCSIGALVVATVTFEGHGTSAPCSFIDVVANSALQYPFPWPVALDCSFAEIPSPPIAKLYVNPNVECPGACPGVVATRQSTWGEVKALYRH